MDVSTFRAHRLGSHHVGHRIWISQSYNGTLRKVEHVTSRGYLDIHARVEMPAGEKHLVLSPGSTVTVY